jgi:hypothetical protein
MEIDPEYKGKMLGSDNTVVLPKHHSIKIVKNPRPTWREIREFMFHKGQLPGSKGSVSTGVGQEAEKVQYGISEDGRGPRAPY